MYKFKVKTKNSNLNVDGCSLNCSQYAFYVNQEALNSVYTFENNTISNSGIVLQDLYNESQVSFNAFNNVIQNLSSYAIVLSSNDNKVINIGSAGGMTRLSTGYTFLNIQEHSKYIVKNI